MTEKNKNGQSSVRIFLSQEQGDKDNNYNNNLNWIIYL